MSRPDTRPIRLFVVDGDADTPAALRALLRGRSGQTYVCLARSTMDAAASEMDPDGRDLLILGIDTTSMPPEKAAAALERTTRLTGGVPVALLDGRRHARYERELQYAGAGTFLWREELSAPLLDSQIRQALAQSRFQAERSEQTATEQALRESEAQLRVMLDEREALQRQFYQSQKMETVGRLAGGIAHDFNNILTAIVGFGTLLSEQVAGSESAERNAREILAAADRASSLTRQLLAFGRRQVLHPVRLSLNETVNGVTGMLRRVIGENIELQIRCARELPAVRADQAQLDSVLMNLVINARDAMPKGGTITIETDEVRLEQAYCDSHVSVKPGHYVRVSVSDTGVGIPPEIQQKIFEPFVTTKEAGKGTGLGLATVYGIIKQSGGYIWVYSEPGHGTTFKMYLPVDGEVVPLPAAPAPVGTRAWSHGSETILLVEDAGVIRELTREVMMRAGYQVLDAGDAEQALAVAAGYDGTIDLLVTDVIMPGPSGVELAARLRTSRPDVPVLFMSGYTDNAVVRNGLLADEAAFLQKPFTPHDLLRKVRQVLEVARDRVESPS